MMAEITCLSGYQELRSEDGGANCLEEEGEEPGGGDVSVQ